MDICWAYLEVSVGEGAHSYVFGACYFIQGLVLQVVAGGDLIYLLGEF